MTQTIPPMTGLMEILGQKWVLRILWELSRQAASFQTLQSQCGDLSPTILTKRLKLLQEQGFILKSSRLYQLSELGNELGPVFEQLDSVSHKWLLARED